MMDFNILIVISCVSLASLCSLLFINKFFRRKTFEEVIAEKKAMTDKLNAYNKLTLGANGSGAGGGGKKPKKLQQQKKDAKREKQRQQRQKATEQQQLQKQQSNDNDSDEQSDEQHQQQHNGINGANDEQQPGLSKTHVEFEPEPEVVTYNESENIVKETVSGSGSGVVGGGSKHKSKKDKKNDRKLSGILLNKNEPLVLKESLSVEEANNFEINQPKDIVELKKQDKKQDENNKQTKKEKNAKKDKNPSENKTQSAASSVAAAPAAVSAPINNNANQTNGNTTNVASSVSNPTNNIEQIIEKQQVGSPKLQSNSNKAKQNKKHHKESAAIKDLAALEKLSDTDTIGVTLLMKLFRRAELTRSEIQILIDYLLNRQQDMPSTHSEWSDDICQKLKRQLEEKEKALAEEQEASIGIQAKLRNLRAEINTERVHMNATIKAYSEKLQQKDTEISGLTQEMQSLNEKLERQNYQGKMLQLQMMQNELALKDKCIGELTHLVQASRQSVDEKNEIIQTQAQQIQTLEQQRNELEDISNNRVFEMEKIRTLETENADYKLENRNLQNALESAKADLAQTQQETETLKTELTVVRNVELNEKQIENTNLQVKNTELTQQLAGFNNKTHEQSIEQTNLQKAIDTLKQQLADKCKELSDFNTKYTQLVQQHELNVQEQAKQHVQQMQELEQLINTLKSDLNVKHNQLEELKRQTEMFHNRENELLQQLQEQKEKNNQHELLAATQQKSLPGNTPTSGATVKNNSITDKNEQQQQIRELFQRLYPDAAKECASTALTLSFDQWVEQVLAKHLQQQQQQQQQSSVNTTNATTNTIATSSSSKSTQISNSNSNNNINNNHNDSTHNSHNYNNSLNNDTTTNNSNHLNNNNNTNNNNNNNNISSSSDSNFGVELQKLRAQNAQLRAKNDELTKLVTKTSNILSELETHAVEQDEYYRGVVRSQEEQILALRHSNGEQQDI